MIDAIEGYNPTEYVPDADSQEDAWDELVQLKKDFFIFGKHFVDAITYKSEARINFIAIEQIIDDGLHADAKRLQEYFDDGRTLPMSPMQAEWLKEQFVTRIPKEAV